MNPKRELFEIILALRTGRIDAQTAAQKLTAWSGCIDILETSCIVDKTFFEHFKGNIGDESRKEEMKARYRLADALEPLLEKSVHKDDREIRTTFRLLVLNPWMPT